MGQARQDALIAPTEKLPMENLRWWLLLIAAVMFSMSGCASAPNQVAGQGALTQDGPAMVSAGHVDGGALPDAGQVPAVDLTGRWVGTWKGLGLFDSLRHAWAEATLVQQGALGVAHLRLDNTIAAGVPWIVRLEGAQGVRLVYRVSGHDAWMRHPATPSEIAAAFTLVNDQLIGTLPSADGPVVIKLARQNK
jgi:hypothetical protein